MCIIFVFIITLALFDKLRNILFYFLEMTISLNSFNNIYNIPIAVLNKIIVLLNIILYPLDGDL